MKLVFASNNQHKLEEVRQILPINVEVISLREIGFVQEIDETGTTLEENSALKAQEVWKWMIDNSLLESIDGVFADDTGLEILALGGAPGVRTARWAGDDACDIKNRQKALYELEGVADRTARFRTVVSLIRNGEILQVEGVVNGLIAIEEEGNGGFGYDPIFIADEFPGMTLADITEEQKNDISHRGKALRAMAAWLRTLLP